MRPRLCIAAAVLAAAGCGSPAGPPAATAPPAADAPDGMLVLAVLGPERVLVADPRTGATRERVLPGGTLCHGPVVALGDRVVYTDLHDRHVAAVSLPLSLRGPVRSLGRADTIAAAPGRLWLGRWARDHRTIALTEIDAAGRTERRVAVRLGRWSWIDAVVDGAPLVHGDHALRLVRGAPSARKGGVRIPGGWPLAAGARQFAWCRGQDLCRAAGVWSPDGSHRLDPPPGVHVRLGGQGAFSPDGRRLALPVRARGGNRVAVVELATGRWRIGARLAGYRAVAWSPSGRWVYATGRRRLTAWAPGAGAPRPLPVRTGGTVMSIATTR
jgi:hypothetical protein